MASSSSTPTAATTTPSTPSTAELIAAFSSDQVNSEYVNSTTAGLKGVRKTCRWCNKTTAENISRQRNHLAGCRAYLSGRSAEPLPSILSSFTFRPNPTTHQERATRAAAAAIFAGGLPFGLWESDQMKALARILNDSWVPPSRNTVVSRLPIVFSELQEQVKALVAGATYINLILDGSDDRAGRRIINISIQIPHCAALYWRTIDTKSDRHTAEEQVTLVKPIFSEIVGGNMSKINGVVTDTNNTMRLFHDEMRKEPGYGHIFYNLCDSHGLQLLVKDIAGLERWDKAFINAAKIISFLKKSKLQLSRIRVLQTTGGGKPKALITSVITRWGTQIGAIRSLLASKDALLAWVRDPLVKADEAKHANLAAVAALVRDHTNFWLELQLLEALLLPIHQAQKVSEAEQSHVGHTLQLWKTVEKRWRTLEDDPEFSGVDWLALFRILQVRQDLQTLDLHFAAWCLTPQTVGHQLEPHYLLRSEAFLKQNCTATAWPTISKDFHDFRAREGQYFGPHSEMFGPGVKPFVAWLRLSNLGLPLAHLARRIFSTLSNSVPSERSFSATNFLHSKSRNRLTAESVDLSCFVFINGRVLARLEKAQEERPLDSPQVVVNKWETASIEELLEMEDIFQASLEPVLGDGDGVADGQGVAG